MPCTSVRMRVNAGNCSGVWGVCIRKLQCSKAGSKPALAHELEHLPCGLAAVADAVFQLGRQLREGLAVFGNEHHGVETEAVFAHGLARDLADGAADGDERLRIVGA